MSTIFKINPAYFDIHPQKFSGDSYCSFFHIKGMENIDCKKGQYTDTESIVSSSDTVVLDLHSDSISDTLF